MRPVLRGFAHFEDYPLTPWAILSRTVPGKWILENVLNFGNFYEQKWFGLQSRGAKGINQAFLHWLGQRRTDRPFFAVLNYFDAHEPYIPPPEFAGRFGIQPKTTRDYQFLVDFVAVNKHQTSERDYRMARDCYDSCIALLDEQLGRLLDTLERQGLLANTDVIITSDHGEGLGLHGLFGHGHSTSLEEIGVPLVILSPGAPAGRVVQTPVSLRDLPATVVNLLGMAADSPFPGHSLAAYWKLPNGAVPPALTSPAFSEQANETAFQTQPGRGREHRGFQMSLVAMGRHYSRDGTGFERLHDLMTDPLEGVNLTALDSYKGEMAVFRRMLLDVLRENPGTAEVEKAYLANYRRWLEDLVREDPSQSVAIGD